MSGSTVKFQDKDTATTSEISNTSTFVPMVQGGVNKKLTIPQIHRDAVAVCGIAANVAAKTATVNNMADFALINGITVTVNFTNGNTAESPTLNVNNTGAFRLIKTNQTVSANPSIVWAANSFLELKYIEVGSNKYWLITSIDDYVNTTINGALADKHTLNAITEKTNANECFDSGIGTTFYRLGSNATNKPTADAVYYIQSNTYNLNGNIRISQIATANDNDIVNTMYTRRAKGTTGNLSWSTWEKLATSSDLEYRNIIVRGNIGLGDNTAISLESYIQKLKDNSLIKDGYYSVISHSWYYAGTPRITEFSNVSLAGATIKVFYRTNNCFDMEITVNTSGTVQKCWKYHENGNDYKVLKQVY